MKKISLSQSEWHILNLLWQQAPKTIMQITAELKEETGWSKHTVITMLARLEAKGAVWHAEGQKAKLYYPAIEKEVVAAEETERFLDRVYRGSVGLLVNSLVQERQLSRQEIEELYEILRKAEER